MDIYLIHSGQTGAPILTGEANTLIPVLNAALVTGFNLLGIDTLASTTGVVTATISAGHGYQNGDIVRIIGADQPEYNGDFAITNVTTQTFDYSITGTPATPATGSITAKIAPLGWTKPFSDVATAAFRPASGNRRYLKIDETPRTELTSDYGSGYRSAIVEMYESMSDINNGVNPSGAVYWRKSQTEDTSGRPWYIIGDGARMYFCVNWSESFPHQFTPYFFGDFISFLDGDEWNSLLSGQYVDDDEIGRDVYCQGEKQKITLISTPGTPPAVNATGIKLARDRSQVGGAVDALFSDGGLVPGEKQFGDTSLPFPNPVDNGLYVQPTLILEDSALRGRQPGLYIPLHRKLMSSPETFSGIVIAGTPRSLLMFKNGIGTSEPENDSGRICIDITGPWA